MNELVHHSKLWEYEAASGGKEPDDEFPTEATHIDLKPPGETEVQEATNQASPVLVAAKKIMNELVDQKIFLKYKEASGGKEPDDDDSRTVIINIASPPKMTPVEDQASPVLVAAKNGITEMVKKILKKYPVAVMDRDKDKKNIILLAVQFRQVHVYKDMLDYLYRLDFSTFKTVFRKVDKDENSALHLAAMLSNSRPWSVPGAALQMQWESKWYQYVRSSSRKINEELLSRINKNGKKPEEVFIDNHDKMVKDGSKWLTKTSESCSVVAALVATVAFASASQVPGGVNDESGFPILSTKPVFQLFAISSLVALCFSVTSLVMFLAILTSRYEVRDFNRGLPMKLILGLTSLFMSIGAMLVSFCAGDFFVVEKKLKFAVYPIYAVMCFPVTFFAVVQLPLYVDLIKATIMEVPHPTEKIHVD
ncbi:uncharacterized protein LOC144551360 [Carex rostrata]